MGEKRKFERIDFGDLGELSFRAHRSAEPTRLCSIRDASATGARIFVADSTFVISARESVNLRLRSREFDLELPARVVWASRDSGGVTFGVRLQLEIALATVRQTYSQWIVTRVRNHASPPARSSAQRLDVR